MRNSRIGKLVSASGNMTIDNLGFQSESVKRGQVFLVVAYGKCDNYGDVFPGNGYLLLSQESGKYSFWEEEEAPIEEYFNYI